MDKENVMHAKMKSAVKFTDVCATIAKSVILHHKYYLYATTSIFTALFFAFCFAEWNSYANGEIIIYVAWSILIIIPLIKMRFIKYITYSLLARLIQTTVFVSCITVIDSNMPHSGPISAYVSLVLLVSTMNGESVYELVAICVSVASLQQHPKSKMEILNQEMVIWCYFFAAVTLGYLFRKVMNRFVSYILF